MWNRINSKLANGSIILSHSGTKYTASGLELILNNIREKGYEIVTVSDLIYKDKYIIDTNGEQHQK